MAIFPAHHGFSGSPMVYDLGTYAVNFIGYDNTKGLNYGLSSKWFSQFLHENYASVNYNGFLSQ